MHISTTLSAPYGHILQLNILRMISDNFSEFISFSFLHNLTWDFKALYLVACKLSYLLKNKMAACLTVFLDVISLTDLKVCFIFVQKKFFLNRHYKNF